MWQNLKKFSGTSTCSSCYKLAPITYIKLIELFKNNNCKVLSTQEDFEENYSKKYKVIYVAQCGHENQICVNHFKNDGQGRKCKSCINQESSLNSINKCKDDKFYCQNVEAEGIKIIVDILKESFIIKRTFESCIADLCIKPINNDDDLWLPIQAKSTLGKASQNRYMFNTFYSDYSNLIVCCISINDKLCWIFDNSNIPKTDVGISKANKNSKSKYDKFEVKIENLVDKYSELYNSEKLISLKEAMTPQNSSVRKEIEYRLIREEKMPYIDFIYPDIQCQNFDFIINNFKVQEKVLVYDQKNLGLTANLSKTIGKNINKGPYEKNDNDFYWFHYQNTLKFYIIPQQVLIDDGYVKSDKFKGKTKMLLYPNFTLEEAQKLKYNTCEYNRYLFSYDNENDIQKIKELFKI